MSADLEPDRAIVRAIAAGLDALGCAHVISDVEAPTPDRAGATHLAYRELGFEILYRRVNLAEAQRHGAR